MDLVFLSDNEIKTAKSWFPKNHFMVCRFVRAQSDIDALERVSQKADVAACGVLDAPDQKAMSLLRQKKMTVCVKPQSMASANAAVSSKACDAVWLSRFQNAAFDLQWFRMAKGNGISILLALDDAWSMSGAARVELLKFWLQAAKLSEKAGNRLRVITGARR
ncbi:MAG: hypothetical protein Q7R47_02055, partial [Candidatus Diapherotrites archaeon]|nr:hypothetical protein [Candidatus Diapherotrites archaeon]